MTTLHDLPRATRQSIRRGRGIAAGRGKSGGRGTKGQKARAGARIPAGFEGGQTKLYRRLPKRRGEGNRPRAGKTSVTLAALEQHYQSGERVNLDTLRRRGLVGRRDTQVRVVATGRLTKALKFAGVSFTASVYKLLYGGDSQSNIKHQTSK